MSKLYLLKYKLPEYVKLSLIKSIVLPKFDFMDVIYHEYDSHGSATNNNQIQRLFNSAIRFAYNLKYNEHVTPSIIKSNLTLLKDRREMHALIMTYNIVNGSASPYLDRLVTLNTNNTRSNNKLIIHKIKNNIQKKTFQISIPKIWNRLDDSIKSKTNTKSFSYALREIFMQKYKDNN
jgi:hypothetical protein